MDLNSATYLLRRKDEPGGAEESLLTLKENLDIESNLFGYSEYGEISRFFPRDKPIPIESNFLLEYLQGLFKFRDIVSRQDSDIIFSQHEMSLPAAIYGSGKLVVFLRDEDALHNTESGTNVFTALVNKIFSKVNSGIMRYILEKSDLVVSNSEFLGEKYEERYNIETATVYPFVSVENYKVDRRGDKILHVNPKRHKGIETTLDVAERMKNEEFLVVGTTKKDMIKKRMEEMDNVEHLGYVEDMKEAYRQTKIALVPSKWEEPYGRIPIEAGASGIPTVATYNGGLPESVGNKKLLVDSENPEEFVEKIKYVEGNYKKFSEKARENTEEKRKEKQLDKFEELMKNVTE